MLRVKQIISIWSKFPNILRQLQKFTPLGPIDYEVVYYNIILQTHSIHYIVWATTTKYPHGHQNKNIEYKFLNFDHFYLSTVPGEAWL